MDEQTERQFLTDTVTTLVEQLHTLGHSVTDTSPKKDGTFDHLSLTDLRRLKGDLRDLLRTLGGARGQ